MSVPLLDLKAQHASLRDELRAAIERVMESQAFILGPEVEALEKELASYSRVKHAVGCASGSDALLLALMALDVGAGDEVITTPFSFFATASAIVRLGARPRFVDIEPRTFNLDAAQIEAAMTERTRAIMPVHLYGQCADADAFGRLRRGTGPVVEDAAQAVGAEDRGRRAGSLGRSAVSASTRRKNLGGAGDGGMLTTDDAIGGAPPHLTRPRRASEYHHREVGLNSRLDSLQAAVCGSSCRTSNAGRTRAAHAPACTRASSARRGWRAPSPRRLLRPVRATSFIST